VRVVPDIWLVLAQLLNLKIAPIPGIPHCYLGPSLGKDQTGLCQASGLTLAIPRLHDGTNVDVIISQPTHSITLQHWGGWKSKIPLLTVRNIWS